MFWPPMLSFLLKTFGSKHFDKSVGLRVLKIKNYMLCNSVFDLQAKFKMATRNDLC